MRIIMAYATPTLLAMASVDAGDAANFLPAVVRTTAANDDDDGDQVRLDPPSFL